MFNFGSKVFFQTVLMTQLLSHPAFIKAILLWERVWSQPALVRIHFQKKMSHLFHTFAFDERFAISNVLLAAQMCQSRAFLIPNLREAIFSQILFPTRWHVLKLSSLSYTENTHVLLPLVSLSLSSRKKFSTNVRWIFSEKPTLLKRSYSWSFRKIQPPSFQFKISQSSHSRALIPARSPQNLWLHSRKFILHVNWHCFLWLLRSVNIHRNVSSMRQDIMIFFNF